MVFNLRSTSAEKADSTLDLAASRIIGALGSASGQDGSTHKGAFPAFSGAGVVATHSNDVDIEKGELRELV